MKYQRVVPRDLFNESMLLKCLGQLYIVAEKHPAIVVAYSDEYDPSEGFIIRQDPSDGSIMCVSVDVTINGRAVHAYTPCNSRQPYPLYVIFTEEEPVAVFNADGTPTAEFLALGKKEVRRGV